MLRGAEAPRYTDFETAAATARGSAVADRGDAAGRRRIHHGLQWGRLLTPNESRAGLPSGLVTDTVHRVIGRYEILRTIGAGGMGVLWLARDPMIDRLVAIKLMREGVESATSRERFMREARSAGRLHHPNIVTIFDVGEQDGQPFIAMQYVEGETLADMIHRQATLSVIRRLRWMEDLCVGLQYAHRAGIIHRDIKPANVMVDEGDAVKILDFGIARLGMAGLTLGGIVGTLNYMAPEQMEGLPIDARADIFSLGALFYELLSYRRAFPGGVADGILTKILHRDPRPLDHIVQDIDPQLVAIVGRCLAKKADSRYADCLALAQEIATVRLRLEQRQINDSADLDTDVVPSLADKVETPKRARQRVELLRIRAEEIHAHLTRAHAAMERRGYDDAFRECERALVLDPGHDEAAALADAARSALERQQIERWVADGHDELSRGALTAASLIVDRALSLNSTSPEAIALRAAVDDARRGLTETQERMEAVIDGRVEVETETKAALVPTLDVAVEASAPSSTTFLQSSLDVGSVKTPRVGSRRRAVAAAVVVLAAGSLLLPRLWRDRPEPPATVAPGVELPLVPSLPDSSAPADPNGNAPGDSGAKPPVQAPVPPIDRPADATTQRDTGPGQQPPHAPTAASPPNTPAVVSPAPPTPPESTNPVERAPGPVPPAAAVPSENGIGSSPAIGPAEPPPATPPAPAPRPSNDAENAAALRAADEAAIRAVLAEYKSAYERLDAPAVKRVVRFLTAAQERKLAADFRDYKSYALEFQNLSISVAGSTATVRGRVARRFVPKAGRPLNTSDDISFELQKVGGAWTVTKPAGGAPASR